MILQCIMRPSTDRASEQLDLWYSMQTYRTPVSNVRPSPCSL